MKRFETAIESSHRVLWIGPRDGAEFALCFEALTHSQEAIVTTATDPDAACRMIAQSEPFDLTVLACPRPLVTTGPAESLRDTLASQPLVQLLGVWCEGEGRTGKLVEGVQRVFWHAWVGWLREWSNQAKPSSDCCLIEILSRDAELAKSLVSALAPTMAAVWSSRRRTISTPPAAIVWDGSQLSGREADELYEVCRRAAPLKTPVVAMLDFPRPETVEAALDLGASGVLAKPFSVALLNTTLRAAMQPAVQQEIPVADSPAPPTTLRDELLAEREALSREAA